MINGGTAGLGFVFALVLGSLGCGRVAPGTSSFDRYAPTGGPAVMPASRGCLYDQVVVVDANGDFHCVSK